ncbi:MAG: hypothetical protein L0Y71_06270 [Gemmataceae bacterium]|nr:hypothetical protein [Gemmataceae bacterium]
MRTAAVAFLCLATLLGAMGSLGCNSQPKDPPNPELKAPDVPPSSSRTPPANPNAKKT